MLKKIYEKDGIRIRPIRKQDTNDIIMWRNNPQVKSCFIFQQDFTRKMHEKWLETQVDTGLVAQFIIEDIENEKSIGSVYLRDIDKTHQKAEFGIFLGSSENTGRGYGTIATKLILEYAFEYLELNKVFLRVFKENEKAIKSYSKAGFIHEGCFKEDVKISNEYKDVVFMAIFADGRR